jgi:thermitase
MQNTWNILPTKVKLLGILGIIVLLIVGFSLATKPKLPSSQKEVSTTPQSTQKVTNLVPKPSDAGKRIEGQIIVKFKPNVTEQQIAIYLQPYQAKVTSKIEALHRYVIQVPAGQEDSILKKLSDDQLVEDAEPDYEIQADFVPNDPLYTSQWGLSNKGQAIKTITGKAGADVKAELAWNVTKGNNVKVAVIDSGINLNHPDFAGQIVGQKVYITSSVEDMFGHGTHVAGAIAALGNNSQGITGVCPECKLLIAKALNDQGTGSSSNVASAMTWAADQGAKVINISAGGNIPTQTIQDAVAYATGKGVVVVSSAGNEGDTIMTYPGAFDSVVSVAATDNKDLLASFSTRGTWVKVAAPGVNMMSTFPTHTFVLQNQQVKMNNDFLSGTSMAAPIVSGVVGLIWASPYGTTNTAVTQRLYTTADKISGTGTYWEYGRINAAKAVGAGEVAPTAVPTKATTTPTNVPTQAEPTDEPTTAVPTDELLSPTPTGPLPTFTCLGACVTPSPSVSAATPTPILGQGGQVPSDHPAKQCKKGLLSGGSPCKTHKSSHGGLLQLIIQILQAIFGLLGIGGGSGANPSTPAPTVAVIPTTEPQITTPPIDQITPTEEPEPTEEPTPTEELTPTVEPTPTGGLTNASFPSRRGD